MRLLLADATAGTSTAIILLIQLAGPISHLKILMKFKEKKYSRI